MNTKEWLENYIKENPHADTLEILKAHELHIKKGLVGYWSIEDFLGYANTFDEPAFRKKYEITEEQAEACLENLRESFDASLGITWDDIDRIILEVKTE